MPVKSSKFNVNIVEYGSTLKSAQINEPVLSITNMDTKKI